MSVYANAVKTCPFPMKLHADDGAVIALSESWTRLVNKDGGETPAWEINSSPVGTLPDGRQCFLSIAIDNTEHGAREGELKLVKKALDCATNSVLITDRDGTILYANEAVERTSGHAPASLIGKKPSVFKSGLHPETFYENLWERILKGETFVTEMTNRHKKGFLFHEEAIITPILEEDGSASHFIAIKTDLTEKNDLQSELYHALDAALEASQAKSRLLTRVSHELRTPMNGIIGMNQLLQSQELSPDQRELTRTIDRSAQSMMAIIEDLLSITALEARDLKIEELDFSLRAAVDRHMGNWAREARSRGLALSLRFSEDVPEHVRGDEHRVLQVLSNLVDNAIKFSPSGNIIVAVDRMVEKSKQTIRFSVTDEGIGVPESFRPHLVEPFRQAEESTTRRYGGLGLGLAIADKLVQAMNGELAFEPNGNTGSRFWFTLDLQAEDWKPKRPEHRPQSPAKDRSGARILLVEDNRDNQIVIGRMLKHLKVEVLSALNGEEALAQLEAEDNVSLILMDCHMPIMDGLETTRAVRAANTPYASVPVIALTADVKEGFREECLHAGMNDFLNKPVSLNSLRQTVAKWLA